MFFPACYPPPPTPHPRTGILMISTVFPGGRTLQRIPPMCILVKIKDGHANISHSMFSAIYIYTTNYYYKTTRNKIKNMPSLVL